MIPLVPDPPAARLRLSTQGPPDDIIKAAPAIVKGAEAAAIPFTAIVKRMLGPAADEVAEMWRDRVRMYRYERQLKCVDRLQPGSEANEDRTSGRGEQSGPLVATGMSLGAFLRVG